MTFFLRENHEVNALQEITLHKQTDFSPHVINNVRRKYNLLVISIVLSLRCNCDIVRTVLLYES